MTSAACVFPGRTDRGRLTLRGRLPDDRRARLTVYLDGQLTAEFDIAPGRFERTIPVPGSAAPFLYVDLEVEPPLQVGGRELGLIFEEMRLE